MTENEKELLATGFTIGGQSVVSACFVVLSILQRAHGNVETSVLLLGPAALCAYHVYYLTGPYWRKKSD